MNDKLMSINQRIEDEKIMFNKLNEMVIYNIIDEPDFENYISFSNITNIKLEDLLKTISQMLVHKKLQPLKIANNNNVIFVKIEDNI